jgi:hypothetical protein
MVTTKSKFDQNAESKKHFKDLINKINAISEKVETADAALLEIEMTRPRTTPPRTLNESKKTDHQMREILGRFNTLFEESIKPVLMEETATGEFDLAVKTKATESGVQVGVWEIKKITEEKNISYDINNVESKATILEDIKTYAAAAAIVKLLNAGKAANGIEISKFLRLDESFRIHYQDALRYKRKFLKTGEAIYEDRYEFCKGKATQLKETIKNKSDNLEIL